MANEKNLRHFTSDQSHEEAVKNGRQGGIISGEARRERRKLRDELEFLLNIGSKGPNAQRRICLALIEQAANGNVRAFEIIRDTIGEKPAESVNIQAETDYSALNEAFMQLYDNSPDGAE